MDKHWVGDLYHYVEQQNKAERGFGLLAQAAKPSETRVVH